MINIIAKKLVAGLIITLAIVTGLLMSFSPAAAQDEGTYKFFEKSGLQKTGDAAGYETGAEMTTVEGIIGNIIYAILGMLGVIFFGFIIYGGLTWMTADGNEEKVKKATGIIMNSLFGFIIVLAASGITYFLIGYFWK